MSTRIAQSHHGDLSLGQTEAETVPGLLSETRGDSADPLMALGRMNAALSISEVARLRAVSEVVATGGNSLLEAGELVASLGGMWRPRLTSALPELSANALSWIQRAGDRIIPKGVWQSNLTLAERARIHQRNRQSDPPPDFDAESTGLTREESDDDLADSGDYDTESVVIPDSYAKWTTEQPWDWGRPLTSPGDRLEQKADTLTHRLNTTIHLIDDESARLEWLVKLEIIGSSRPPEERVRHLETLLTALRKSGDLT